MFEIGIRHVVRTAAVWGFASFCAFAQTELKPIREIPLPVSSSRGSYAHFPIRDMAARQFFSMRVAPDQSVLVLDSDTSGKWPLVRIRKWWTDKPASEVLYVPGWSSADAKHIDSIHVDVQITPDGRYAVCFAGAYWMEKSAFLLRAPSGYVARKPDVVITVVNLEQWKIVNTIHTTGMTEGPIQGLRVISDKWVVLDFRQGNSPFQRLLYRYDTMLMSLPDLREGPGCVSDRPFRGHPSLSMGAIEVAPFETHNDAVCRDVLGATSTSSVEAMEILIYRGQDVLPANVQRSSHDLQETEDDYFRGWG
jgi:hypothetical protein